MPEWWGLLVEGDLVQVIRWREAARPTLADFNATVPNGAEFEIGPVHVATAG